MYAVMEAVLARRDPELNNAVGRKGCRQLEKGR